MNLSRLFLETNKQTKKQTLYRDYTIFPFLLSESSQLTTSSQTFPPQLWTLILSMVQIFPSKPINMSFVIKDT